MIAFFDTSALMPKYVEGVHSYRVRKVISPRNAPVFISELSLVEAISTLARHCRGSRLSHAEFTLLKGLFEDDLVNGMIEIVPLTTIDLRRAQHLLEFAGVEQRRKLDTQDAIIAVTCLELALQLGRRVTFYTRDWKQYTCMYGVNAYRSALKLRLLGESKDGTPTSSD